MRRTQRPVFHAIGIVFGFVLVNGCGSGGGHNGGGGGQGAGGTDLGGVMNVADFVIPAGQTRTVTSDLALHATGNVEIDGTLQMEPGVNVAILAEKALTLHGQIMPVAGKASHLPPPATASGRAATRAGQDGTYVVLSANNVNVDFTQLGLAAGVTSNPGQSIYVLSDDEKGSIHLTHGNLTTSDGSDGLPRTRPNQLGTQDGGSAGHIYVGTQAAVLYSVFQISAEVPGLVQVNVALKTGKGGNGGQDPAGQPFTPPDAPAPFSVIPGNAGNGGNITLGGTRKPEVGATRFDLTGATFTLGGGGDGGSGGVSRDSVASPTPRKAAPGKNGASVFVSGGASGAAGAIGGTANVGAAQITSGEIGKSGAFYVAAGDGGDGVPTTSGVGGNAPGKGGSIVLVANRLLAGATTFTDPLTSLETIYVTGGGGGNSMSAAFPGGPGGTLSIGSIGSAAGIVNSVSTFKFGIGGKGYNGCGDNPPLGSNGGDAGTAPNQKPNVAVVLNGTQEPIGVGNNKLVLTDAALDNSGNLSFSGGAGGSGNPGMPGGKHGLEDDGASLGADGAAGTPCSGSGAYTPTPIGPGQPLFINKKGHVAGYSIAGGGWFWDGTNLTKLGSFQPTGLNDNDVVVGNGRNGNNQSYANIWDPVNGARNLHITASNGTEAYAQVFGINNAGTAVGIGAVNTSSAQVQCVVLWTNGQSNINYFQPPAGIDNVSMFPLDINDGGVVVGFVMGTGITYLPCRWINGTATLLTPLSGQSGGKAYIVNQNGDAYGDSGGEVALWKAGSTMGTDLHATFVPTGANSAGDIAGGIPGALILNGNLIGVNTLLAQPPALTLTSCNGINDSKWIIAGDATNAYLLKPN